MKQHYYVSKAGRVLVVIFVILLTIIYGTAIFNIREELVFNEFIWLLLIFIGFIFYSLYSIYGKKILFSSEGILYKDLFNTYQMKWRDIKEIGIGVENSRSIKAELLYFSLDKINPHSNLAAKLDERKISERFIKMIYDKRVVEDISKYTELKLFGSNGKGKG